ncbi:hypothetical protein GP486_006059, partial [Trichoglossum hirsutum]
ASISNIWTYVEDFYRERAAPGLSFPEVSSRVAAAARLQDGVIASESSAGEPLRSQSQTSVPEQLLGATCVQTVDRPFKETIWRWLTGHPDVRVGKDKVGNKLSLEQAESYTPSTPGTAARGRASGRGQSSAEIDPDGVPANPPTDGQRSEQLRVYGNQEHVWRALTGHGVDWTKCPRLEFICLSVIAKHREGGILQGDLVRETGQDKRSVPKRTDVLAQKGYIEKRAVIAKGSSTSHLTLKRFVRVIPPSVPHNGEADEEWVPPAGHKAWLGDNIDLLSLCRAVFIHLEKQKILTIADLKRVLGIFHLRWQSRVLSKLLRRLELMGCVRRVRAETQFNKPGNYSKCVKFLREPEGKEWNQITRGAAQIHHSGLLDTKKDADSDAEDGGELVNFVEEGGRLETEDLPEPLDSRSGAAETTGGEVTAKGVIPGNSSAIAEDVREARRPLPLWEPDIAPGNLLFRIIEASGTEGISTMDLKDASFGPFCERPMEVALSRISTDWRVSQPPHLRHLAVVRDAAQRGRNAHYHFYTHDNFQKLVESGDAIWSSAEKPEKAKGQPATTPEVDEYGFPHISDHRFQRDGLATLKESALAVESRHLPYNKSTVVYFEREDGTYDIDWGREGKHGSRREKPKPEPPGPPKPRGRPRKYPQGLEPYKPENKKKIKVAQAEAKAAKKKERAEKQKQRDVLPRSDAEAALGDHPSAEPAVSSSSQKDKRKQAEATPARASSRISRKHQTTTEAGSDGPGPVASVKDAEARIDNSTNPTVVTTPETTPVAPTKKGRGRPRKSNEVTATQERAGVGEAPDLIPATSEAIPSPPEGAGEPGEAAAVEEAPDLAISVAPPGEDRRGSRKDTTDKALLEKKPSNWSLDELKEVLREERSVMTAPGVYIRPPGYVKPTAKGRGRPRKSLLVVFKSNRLCELNLGEPDPGVEVDTEDLRSGVFDDEMSGAAGSGGAGAAGTKRRREEANLGSDSAERCERPLKRPAKETATVSIAGSTDTQRAVRGRKRARDVTDQDAASHNPNEPVGKRVRTSTLKPLDGANVDTTESTEKDLAGNEEDGDLTQRESVVQPGNQSPGAPNLRNPDDQCITSEIASGEVQEGSALEVTSNRGPHSGTGKEGRKAGKQRAGTHPAEKDSVISKAPRRKAGPPLLLHGGSLAFRRRKTILDILDKCGGVFPADKPLWHAWATVWMKENPGSGKPDYQTLKKVQKALVDSGKAKMLWFNFTTTKGAQCSRSLILRPEIETDSLVVKDMQSKIIKEDGDNYFPPGVEVPADIRKILESRADFIPKVVPIQEKIEVPRLFLPDGALQKLQEKQERAEIRRLERERKSRERQVERIEYEERKDARKRMKRAATAARLGRRALRPEEALDMIYSGTSRVSRLHGLGRSKTLLWQEALVPESFDPHYNVSEQYTTLSAPTQTFHRPSGTFGTNFLVTVRRPGRLAISIPESLEDIISRARGRRPNPQRGRFRDFMRTKFEYEVNEVMRWEERGNGVHFRTPDVRFINHMVPTITSAPDRPPEQMVTVDRVELYTLDQPPDLDVPTDNDEELGLPQGRASKGGRKSFRTHPTKLYKTRKLTAMEATPIGQGPEVEYRHGSGQAKERRLRGPMSSRTIPPETAKRLLIAVIVVRTLIGGTERIIDWVIINRLFPQYDQEFIRKRWVSIRAVNKLHMEKLQRDFQEAFLTAYESKVVPPIDYDNLGGYDWNAVVDWALANLDMPSSRTLPDLPATHKQLMELYNIRDDPQPNVPFREEYLGHSTLVHRRKAIARSTPFVIPLRQPREERPQRLLLTESFVRANTITSAHLYNGQKAKEKLLPLCDKIDEAVYNLRSRKVLTHVKADRTLPGRNFDLADSFFYALKKHISDTQFVRAGTFKLELDSAFVERGWAEVPFLARDGDMLALNNLISHGRVELVSENLPDIKSGLIEGYVTRHIDKKRLRFEMKIKPTDGYIYGNPLVPLPHPPCGHLGDDTKPIPLWYDIHGNFVAVMWWKVLAAVMSVLALRPGIGVGEAVKSLKPAVEEWELRLLMEWLVRAKVAREVLGGGFVTEEWFWMLIDPETRDV